MSEDEQAWRCPMCGDSYQFTTHPCCLRKALKERNEARALLWKCRERIRDAIRGEGWLLPLNVEELVDEIEALLSEEEPNV